MKTALIATAKGLVVYEGVDDHEPLLRRIHFTGFAVTMAYVDQRSGRWWAGISHKHWGQKLHYSDDRGGTWNEATLPSYQGALLPDGNPAKLKQIWCMSAGGTDHPQRLWLGAEPAAVFRSDDAGQSFEISRSLWDHPSRAEPGQWFGAGSDRPFLHTIEVDPRQDDHVYVAVSSAGVFETTDGGYNWQARNNGLKATYLPNPHVHVGHDPHCLYIHPANPNILWQQNHCGIYYSRDSGAEWHDVSVHDGIPYYGFALAIDEEDPANAWVIPVESDEQRIAPNLTLQVFKTQDFGQTWESDSSGLPDKTCFDIVLRQSFVKNLDIFLFGTTNGNLYFRNRWNPDWTLLHHSLTKVNAVHLF